MSNKNDGYLLSQGFDSKTDTEKIVYLTTFLKELKSKNPSEDFSKDSIEKTIKSVYETLDKLVQSKYDRLFKRDLIFGIKNLYDISKIAPMVHEDVVQSAYRRLIEEKALRYSEKMHIIYNLTKIKPEFSEKTVQLLYEESIKKEKITDFEILRTVTGKKPREDLTESLNKLYNKRKNDLKKIREKKD